MLCFQFCREFSIRASLITRYTTVLLEGRGPSVLLLVVIGETAGMAVVLRTTVVLLAHRSILPGRTSHLGLRKHGTA